MSKFLLIWYILILFCIVPSASGLCLDLSRLNRYFLQGDYKAAIIEGEKILATQEHSQGEDELYYLLGLSYLKDGNYLRASDIFEIIQHEFKYSRYKDDAKMSQGDVYMLLGKYPQAQECYESLLESSGQRLKPQLYYRLTQLSLRTGDTKKAEDYLARHKKEFPMSVESMIDADIPALEPEAQNAGLFYFVQVGSFANELNAKNLTAKLVAKGFAAYIDKIASSSGDIVYKVRVGKFNSRKQAVYLGEKLSQQGYPTKVYP